MALRLWMPMHDGTLNNYGLSEVKVSSTGTSSVNDDGKIGKCCYLDGTSFITLSSNMMEFINGHAFSYGCWFKTSGLATNMTVCGVMAFTYGCSLFINSNGNLYGRLDDGTAFVSIMSTTKLFDSQWHHLFFTYDGATAKIYIDGKIEAYKNTGFKSRYTNVGAIGTELNNAPKYIGKGYINDVRVYDHCLSEKEIKLLAQGLVLHYPMNQIDRTRNFILNSAFNESNKFVLRTGTEGGFRNNLAVIGKAGDTFTLSVKLRGNANMNCYLIQPEGNHAIPLTNKSDLHETEYREFSLTFTIKSGYTLQQIYLCTRYGNSIAGDWFEIMPSSLMLQYGTNPSSMWTPAWEDPDSWLDSTEYDCSGLCNNGITVLPPPHKKSGSPRNSGCYEFNGALSDGKEKTGAHYIENTSFIIPREEIAICYWRKRTAIGYSGGSFFTLDNKALSSYDLYGITTYDNHYRINLVSETGDTTYISLNCISSNTGDIGNWEFHTLTFDGTTAKAYINGNLIHSTSKDKKYKITVSNNNGLTIGYSKAGGAFRYFNGYMSDFRVYCTCLSDEDIQNLYNTVASITNTGTLLLSGELIE